MKDRSEYHTLKTACHPGFWRGKKTGDPLHSTCNLELSGMVNLYSLPISALYHHKLLMCLETHVLLYNDYAHTVLQSVSSSQNCHFLSAS